MSWMMRLAETYDNCSSELWKGADTPGAPVLVGIGHTVTDFHAELCIDSQGNFIRNGGNRILPKEEQRTVIPCTEVSAGSRTGNIAPHPLFDEIRYLAGDLSKYKVNNNGINNSGHHVAYMEFLNGWCNSEYGFEKLRAIRDYLEKNTLTADLIDAGILLCQNGEISINKDLKGLKDPAKLRVRLRVQISGDPLDSPWLDKAFWESYHGYLLLTLAQTSKDLCYVSGEEETPARLHPKVPMVSGESNTKLISSNDGTNYTFRGRFSRPEEAFCVGYETSQKAYSALRWLKDKQSYRNSEQAFVIWGTRGETLPPTFADSQEVIEAATEEWSDDLALERPSPNADTSEIEARRVIKAMRGYGQRLTDDSQVIVLGFGSAVPGRLAVTYYQELRGSDFLDCLKFWHGTCQWTHRYKWEQEKNSENLSKKPKPQRRVFCGAPAPRDIGEAAYGARVKPKTLSRTAERLASSILNKTPLPADLVKELFYRACRPLAMGRDEYEKVITIACALIRKSYNDRCQTEPIKAQTLESYKEVLKMSLEQEQTDRSYLFGRLLACGRRVEERVLYLNARRGEKEEGSESGTSGLRATNAERLMTQFSIKPMKTWAILEKKLKYCWEFLSLRDPGAKYAIETEINKIISSLGSSSAADERLSPLFIIGYRAQLEQFYKDRKEKYNSKLEKQTKEEQKNEIDGQ